MNGKRQCRTVSFSVAALLFSFLLFFFLCFFSFAFLLLWIALASLCCSWLLIVTPQAPKSPPDRPPDHPQAAQDHPKTTPRPPFGPSWPLLRTTNLFCFFWGSIFAPTWLRAILNNQNLNFCSFLLYASLCFAVFCYVLICCASLCFASRCFFDFFHKKRSETATFREILGSNA